MERCVNHLDRKPLSVCHGCGRQFCESCLDEGEEFYYCKSPECHDLFLKQKRIELLPAKIKCPASSSELELTDDERATRKLHCAVCETFLDYTVDPPKVLDASKYSLLLTTMNQSDIAVIKSLLDDAKIDYYVYDEEFLAVRPLVQPVRFLVAEDQMEDAKELLKGLDLNLFGISQRNDDGGIT